MAIMLITGSSTGAALMDWSANAGIGGGRALKRRARY